MRTVPSFPPGDPKASQGDTPPPQLTLRLPLRLLTPMIGGGVKPLEPDRAVPVRPTAIRGALRWWWRALCDEQDLGKLREREAKIFGGVHLGEDLKTEASWVSVWVENVAKLRKVPAGAHRVDGGLPKPLADWNMPRGLGYALFPLQATRDERLAWARNSNMPTRDVIDQLEFDLVLEIRGRRRRPGAREPNRDEPKKPMLSRDELKELLDAVHWWLHFGGVGARTRRGFGAVELRGEPKIELLNGAPDYPEVRDRISKLKERPAIPERDGIQPPPGRPTVFKARLLLGERVEPTAAYAHEVAVGLLRDFRQGPGLGRAPVNPITRRPGQSFWPEADLVKDIRGAGRYEHPIRTSEGTRARLGAPRAAFGLPILVRFKDPLDSQADADIVALPSPPKGREVQPTNRWASPVITRPVPVAAGFRPAVLVLNEEAVPRRARVKNLKADSTRDVEVKSSEGSQPPIHGRLMNAGGDALQAFAQWLKDVHHFQERSP